MERTVDVKCITRGDMFWAQGRWIESDEGRPPGGCRVLRDWSAGEASIFDELASALGGEVKVFKVAR